MDAKAIDQIAREEFSKLSIYHEEDRVYAREEHNGHRIFYRSSQHQLPQVPKQDRWDETKYAFIVDLPRKAIVLENLRISTFFQKQGYGRELVAAKERILSRLGFDRVYVHRPAEHACAFWERMGYAWEGKELVKNL